MAQLFELSELDAYVQRPVPVATAGLLRTLVTGAVEVEAGMVFTSPPDSIRLVALRVAARLYANPAALNSEQLGPQSAGYGLTSILRDDERAIVRAAGVGRGSVYSVPLTTPADWAV